MADRWIVSRYKFKEHKSFEIASAERKRLRKLHKDDPIPRTFFLYRIKTPLKLETGSTFEGSAVTDLPQAKT